MLLQRRKFLCLLSAPLVVSACNIMPVKMPVQSDPVADDGVALFNTTHPGFGWTDPRGTFATETVSEIPQWLRDFNEHLSRSIEAYNNRHRPYYG